MAKNVVVWDGLDEYLALLRDSPERLTTESARHVEGAANAAAFAIRSGYPVRTGTLRDKVAVKPMIRRALQVGWRVVNTAPHAALFELGTRARHTSIGANRGSMPPGRVFVPQVIKARRSLYDRIKDLLRREGGEVSGDA